MVLSIDPSILTDDCATNSAKQIWDAYTTQYKEKGFVLRFTLFTHLVTTKVATFKTITAYNADFKITIDKLSSSGENLPADLRLAAYLHGIEVTYPDFAAAQRSSARTKIPELSAVMAELEDEGRQARAVESTALSTRSKDNKKGYNHKLSRGGHKGSSSTLRPKGNKEKCEYCDSKGHSEDSCWKKHPDRAPSWWNKDGPSKSDSKNHGRKDGTTFNLAAIAGAYNHKTASHAFPSRINEMGARWNIDTGCSDHMCNNRSYFSSYKPVHQPTTIQGVGGVFSAIGIGNVPLTVESRSGKKSKVLLLGVLYVPGLFTNLISGSKLLKKGYYLHGGDQTIISCSDNMEIAFCPIQDRLFILKLHKIPKIPNVKFPIPRVGAATNSSTTFVKTWHRRLGHLSYLNLKQLGNAKGIDMSKLKSEKDLPLCQICIRAKQRQNPSYKPQPLADDICEELHIDFMGSITPTSWNSCRYALTITDSCSRCCWVEDLHEKREAGSALKKFVSFIENQTNQKVKHVRMDQSRDLGFANWSLSGLKKA